MSKRNRKPSVAPAPAPATVELRETESGAEIAEGTTLVLAPTAPESAPAPVAPAPRVVGAAPTNRDALYYSADTETSFLASALLSGTYTKNAMRVAFLAKFCAGDAAEEKKKKTTFSVFFSDVKRPIGTYHASRGLRIVADENGILSVSPSSLRAASEALRGGILTELRGVSPKKTPKRYAAVLAAFGLSTENENGESAESDGEGE